MSHQLFADDTTRYRLHPDVVWIARPDGSARLMHMSANVYAIDADSTALLTAILERGAERTASELAARYGVDEVETREDVQTFISALRKQQLLQPLHHHVSGLEKAWDGAARTLVPGVLCLLDLVTLNLHGKVWGLLWAARWAVAQFGWARALREWERVYPQPATAIPASTEQLEAIDLAVRHAASRSLLSVECKERSLACLALARKSSIPAQLIVGVTHNPLQGHVWVEAGGRVISDNPEHCRPFEPVVRYG